MFKLELYKFDSCPYCQKVLAYLEEENIVITLKDIKENSSFKDELVSKYGKGQVPCLIINNNALYESDDIITWLKKNYKLENQVAGILKANIEDCEIYFNRDGEGNHCSLYIISSLFESMSLLKQHQLVMGLLKEFFKEKIHALHLKTFSKQKWEKEKHLYFKKIN